MKNALLTLTCATALAAPALSPAQTDTAKYLAPPDAAWGIMFDPGKVLNSSAAEQAMGYLDEQQRARVDEIIDGLSGTLGLDLRQDLGRVVAFGHGYNPEQIGAAVEIGAAQTNVEGLLLAAENYESYEYGDLLVHSVQQSPDEPRIYCAVLPGTQTGYGAVLLSPAVGLTEKMVDDVRAGAEVAAPDALGGDQFLHLWINEIPQEAFAGNAQGSRIAGMIQSFELRGHTNDQRTSLQLDLAMVSEARARQVYQMASGAKAFIELAATQEPNEEVAALADMLAYLSVTHPDQGRVVTVRADVTRENLTTLLDMLDETGAFEQLDLD